MSDDVIETIETTLDVEVPDNYKDLLKQVDQQYGQSPYPFPFPYDGHFLTGSKELIELNNLLWSSPEGAWSDVAEPVDYFFIGQDGCGNYFCIDPDDEESPVFFLCHDPLEFSESAPTLAEYVANLANPPA